VRPFVQYVPRHLIVHVPPRDLEADARVDLSDFWAKRTLMSKSRPAGPGRDRGSPDRHGGRSDPSGSPLQNHTAVKSRDGRSADKARDLVGVTPGISPVLAQGPEPISKLDQVFRTRIGECEPAAGAAAPGGFYRIGDWRSPRGRYRNRARFAQTNAPAAAVNPDLPSGRRSSQSPGRDWSDDTMPLQQEARR
jgi:hypothetical protein